MWRIHGEYKMHSVEGLQVNKLGHICHVSGRCAALIGRVKRVVLSRKGKEAGQSPEEGSVDGRSAAS